jgi:hypothetical protein
MDARPKLVNEQTGQFYPIATFEDLKETLKLMQVGASGVRPYIAKWFNDVFIPAFRDLGDKPNEDKDDETGTIIIKKEKHVGLTIEQLAEKAKEILGGQKLSSGELRNKYLYPLINQGIIDKVQSEINGSQNIYFPVEEEGNIFSIFEDPDNPKLKVSNPDIFPSKSFLKEEFRILSKHNDRERVVFEKNISCYKLVDIDGSEITVDQLLEKYFDNPEECFVKACKYREEDNNSNNEDDNNGYGSTSETLSKAAATNNILYQQQVIQKQKNIYFSHPSPRRVFTEFSKSDIEEFFKESDILTYTHRPIHICENALFANLGTLLFCPVPVNPVLVLPLLF